MSKDHFVEGISCWYYLTWEGDPELNYNVQFECPWAALHWLDWERLSGFLIYFNYSAYINCHIRIFLTVGSVLSMSH